MLFIKFLLYTTFVFKVKNASIVKKSKIVAEKAKNNAFIILVFFKKNITNILLKNTAINIKK